MAAFSGFYPWVALDCPGVPTPVMDDAIRRGAREFSKMAAAYEHSSTLVMAAGTRDYSPSLPTDTEVISILRVQRTATEYLTAKSQEFIDAQSTSSGAPWAYAVMMDENPLKVRMYPTPAAIETLTARYTIMPTMDAATVNDKFYDWYLEGVTAYAKYWLFRIPNQPWSNAEEAHAQYTRFEARVGETVIHRQQQRAELPTTVEMTPLA